MPILPLIGSIYQAQTNQEIANDANATSIALMREQNRFNAEEAAKSREWMSYDNQRKLMEKAGLNPALMFGQGQLSAAATQATASGIPSIQSYPINNPFGSSSLSEISSAMKNLAEAKKAGADTEAVMKLLDKQALALDLQNEYQSILNTYQGKKSATEIAKMIQDIEKQYVEIDNLIKEGRLTEAQTRLTNVQEEIGKENRGLAEADRLLREALADKREEYTTNILNKQIEDINTTKKQGNMYTQQGKAAIMQGQAALTSVTAQSEDLRATRAARINQLNADAREKDSLAAINEYELDTRPSKMIASWHNFVDMVTSTVSATTSVNYLRKELESIGYEIELAKKHNDWYLMNQLMDNAKDIAISIGSIAIARKNFGGAGKPKPIGFNK